MSFAEPIAEPEDLARAVRRLTADLCRGLAAEAAGARRLELACYRVDGAVERVAVGTARPSRDPRHLARLLEEKLETIDPALGIEDMVLTAALAEPLSASQFSLRRLEGCRTEIPSPLGERVRVRAEAARSAGSYLPPRPSPSHRSAMGPSLSPRGEGKGDSADEAALAALVDRLGNRLGLANLRRLAPRESHLPERAVAALPAMARPGKPASRWPVGTRRPIRLLAPPEPVEAMAPVPDDPPVMFRWRRLLHRVRRADGPERIAGEWWRAPARAVQTDDPGDIRDYYRVEDETGRRFWLYRAGLYRPDRPARWFIHGVFA